MERPAVVIKINSMQAFLCSAVQGHQNPSSLETLILMSLNCGVGGGDSHCLSFYFDRCLKS